MAFVALLTGCAPSAEQLTQEKAERDANIWAAGGHEGSPPPSDPASVKKIITSIARTADWVLINGSSDADCIKFQNAFEGLVLAEFNDERNDYIAPLQNAISQVTSGCDTRGTWEGTIDDVVTVAELGGEYADRF